MAAERARRPPTDANRWSIRIGRFIVGNCAPWRIVKRTLCQIAKGWNRSSLERDPRSSIAQCYRSGQVGTPSGEYSIASRSSDPTVGKLQPQRFEKRHPTGRCKSQIPDDRIFGAQKQTDGKDRQKEDQSTGKGQVLVEPSVDQGSEVSASSDRDAQWDGKSQAIGQCAQRCQQ